MQPFSLVILSCGKTKLPDFGHPQVIRPKIDHQYQQHSGQLRKSGSGAALGSEKGLG
jgi:hypothetical protein